MTIPCVIGPYTNVGATFRLTDSWWRPGAEADISMQSRPLRHGTAIATSSAQNDSGVFEFSFRDERYMLFEGAGAISRWTLSLPEHFRAFDYRTISDVILRLNYAAEEDDALLAVIRKQTGALEQTLKHYLSTTGIVHVFSLRQAFPDVWHKLVRSKTGSSVKFLITEEHLPSFFSRLGLRPTQAEVLLETKLVPTVKLELDGVLLSPTVTLATPKETDWSKDREGLYKAVVSNTTVVREHSISLISSGNLGAGTVGATAAIDESKLEDILLRVVLML